ncbi:MAG: LysR substrate-binding domain-containing protein [Gammaproteobacteria bacterium]|nr:LysR substrate-binding domain-containing protein [Gammaproteobacteria bacterium]
MTLSELRYIVALARKRHFGRAAEFCHVSQPTLSVAVKKLEDELGVLLFERGKNDVGLTPIGLRIVEQAQRVLEEAEQLRSLASEGQDPLNAPLRVGAIYTIGPYLFPYLIPVLHRQTPQMPLIVDENYTSVLREKLKQGELDVIIIALPFNEPGILTLPLYSEPFVALVPEAHAWLKSKKDIAIGSLADENVLLLGAGNCFRDQVLEVCPDCGGMTDSAGSMQKTLEGSSLETIRHMVASGMGITVLPCTAATSSAYSKGLLGVKNFAPPAPSRKVALAWRSSFPRPQAIEALRQAILASELACVKWLTK